MLKTDDASQRNRSASPTRVRGHIRRTKGRHSFGGGAESHQASAAESLTAGTGYDHLSVSELADRRD